MPSVKIFLPAEQLRSYVTFYYFVEADGPFSDFLYPEWGNVRLSIRGDWWIRMPGCYPDQPQLAPLYGPTDRRGEIVTTGGKTAGFGMTPLGWDRFIRGNAGDMANRVRDIGDDIGIDGATLRAALADDGEDAAAGAARFDALLIDLLSHRAPNGALAIAADRALRLHPAGVPAFPADVGVSTRTLHRLCLNTFGFPPKRLLRRQRFLDTLGRVRVNPDGSIGAVVGDQYFDQAHFNRDFVDFMGMTPRAYLQAPRALMQQAAIAQAQLGIDLSFRLPPQP